VAREKEKKTWRLPEKTKEKSTRSMHGGVFERRTRNEFGRLRREPGEGRPQPGGGGHSIILTGTLGEYMECKEGNIRKRK